MDQSMLTPGQTAQLLGISTRTLRRWSSAFGESLNSGARRKGRKRVYTGQDVNSLRKAQELLDEGLTLEQVGERLPAISADEQTTALTLTTEASMAIGQALERTARLSETVSDHDGRLDRLEQLLDERRRWDALPFWRRILSKPGAGNDGRTDPSRPKPRPPEMKTGRSC